MKIEIKDIIDKHKNVPAFIAAHGPSLNDYIHRLKEFKDKGYVIFSCNLWYYIFNEPTIDYWVLANSEDTIEKLHSQINKFKTTVMYADTLDRTPIDKVSEYLKDINYISYDERHYDGNKHGPGRKKIVPWCCERLDENRPSIQQELQGYTGKYDEINKEPYTVSEHMITFAILMGCNPIYVSGIDLNYGDKAGHHAKCANHEDSSKLIPKSGFNINGFSPHREIIINNLKILNRHAKEKGIDIYDVSLSPRTDSFVNKII